MAPTISSDYFAKHFLPESFVMKDCVLCDVKLKYTHIILKNASGRSGPSMKFR